MDRMKYVIYLNGGKKMPDLKKVIDALEKCAASECDEKCPYYEIHFGCRPKLMLDALSLLKEQEKRIEDLEDLRRIEQEGSVK